MLAPTRSRSSRGWRHAAIAAAGGVLLLWACAAAAECSSPLTTETIPLPVWATQPNEGDTWGVMPVFLRICPDGERTESIIAPSFTWNSVIQYTGTFRWYYYPTEDTSFTAFGTVSTNINYDGFLIWERSPTAAGLWTDEATVRVQRSVFYRFFGLGPDTAFAAQTSYTRLRALASLHRGYNIARHLNLGATLGAEHDVVERLGVTGLPLSPNVFPDAPGMRGATLLSQGVSLRYDDRRGAEYAEHGSRVQLSATVLEGLSRSPTFVRAVAEASTIVPELDLLSGAAHVYWSAVTSGDAPFYQQSSLGGAFLLRGFMPDRFIDQQAWLVEFEQRIRLLQTHIFGVTTDWRMDPFLAVGQVFGAFDSALSNPRIAGGVGFRAYVHPNVVGRIDVASGGEGLNVYVELGYPY